MAVYYSFPTMFQFTNIIQFKIRLLNLPFNGYNLIGNLLTAILLYSLHFNNCYIALHSHNKMPPAKGVSDCYICAPAEEIIPISSSYQNTSVLPTASDDSESTIDSDNILLII